MGTTLQFYNIVHWVRRSSCVLVVFPACLSIGPWDSLWRRRRFPDCSSEVWTRPCASPSNHSRDGDFLLFPAHDRRHHAFNYVEDSAGEIIQTVEQGDLKYSQAPYYSDSAQLTITTTTKHTHAHRISTW